MMGRRIRFGACVMLGAMLLVAAIGATAQTVRIGGTGDPGSGNSFPFGAGNDFGTRYQQVYNAGLFPGPMTIAEIDFFNNNYLPGVNPASGGFYTIYLSTTSAAVNGLDSNMGNNVGGNNALFFQGLLGSTVPIVDGEYTMQLFGGPFAYDPSAGNLLMDVWVSGGSFTHLFLDARSGTFGTDSSRMHDFGDGFESRGLVTQFRAPEGDVVPEAGTLASLSGFIGFAGVWLRRRIAGQSSI